ncbi:MAG TPA: hypothetical protein VMW58_03800, partial [Anaerolineae bacterium]|nr:hypothetical protein [Anaerolineae bacterium]
AHGVAARCVLLGCEHGATGAVLERGWTPQMMETVEVIPVGRLRRRLGGQESFWVTFASQYPLAGCTKHSFRA